MDERLSECCARPRRVACANLGKRPIVADDADAAADKTGRLGGKVVVPPHDLPGFRNAVLADPQGAVFSVSELRPAG